MKLEFFGEQLDKKFDVVLKENWKDLYNTVTAERMVAGKDIVLLAENLFKDGDILHVWMVDKEGDYLVTKQSDKGQIPYTIYPELVEKIKETAR